MITHASLERNTTSPSFLEQLPDISTILSRLDALEKRGLLPKGTTSSIREILQKSGLGVLSVVLPYMNSLLRSVPSANDLSLLAAGIALDGKKLR